MFASPAGTWSQQQELISTNGAVGDAFGGSVALAGTTALVGAPNVGQTGATYLFAGGGTSWAQQQEVVPTDAPAAFGTSVALSANTAVVGANDAAYIYSIVPVTAAPSLGPRSVLVLAALLLGCGLVALSRAREIPTTKSVRT